MCRNCFQTGECIFGSKCHFLHVTVPQSSPAEGEELRLCAEASALAKPYALMIVQGATRIAPEQLGDKARAAYEAWRAATQG